MHLSDNLDEIKKAQKRIKYEELLKYQVSMKYLHYMRPSIKWQSDLRNRKL